MLTQTLFVMLSKAKHLFFNAILRSNAFGDVANARCEIKTSFISLTQSQHSHSFRMTSSQKNKSRVNCYIIAYFFVNCNLCLCCVFVFPRQTQGQFLYFLRFQR